MALVVMKRMMNLLKEDKQATRKSPHHSKAEEDNSQEYDSSQEDT